MKKKRTSIIKKIVILLLLPIIGLGVFQGAKVYRNVKNVVQYRTEVEQAAKKYNVSEYTDLLMSIVYTESRGKGIDLMQSSESLYGEKDRIKSQQESIDQGVQHFAEVYGQAKKADCDLWTAVQAYNYGVQYIDYVKENGRRNSIKLAESYSKNVLSPVLGNQNQSTYRYWHPLSLFYNGGYLYRDGGNMFYADLVKLNQKLINIGEKF